MDKLIRYYNQNKSTVWTAIFAVIFIILLIHTMNALVREKDKKEQEEIAKNMLEQNTAEEKYEKQSQSVSSGDEVPKSYQQDFGRVINSFLTFCKNHEPERAYGLLTQECKDVMFKTQEIFIDQYYKPRFTEEKTFSFQSWSSEGPYIYLVKIFPNMLITGEGSNQTYTQEYITATKENDTYKVSVNSFITLLKDLGSATENGVSISAKSAEIYMDYEIVNFVVTNGSENDVILDTSEETESTYLLDRNNIKFTARMFENLDSDLLVESKQKKEVKIRFSHPYQSGNRAMKFVFSDMAFGNESGSMTIEVGKTN